MKHTFPIFAILLGGFLVAQFLGLFILNAYIDPAKSAVTGETEFKDLPLGERPQLEEKNAYLPVILAILIGTGFLWLLIRFKWTRVWKAWFLLAVLFTLIISLGAFMPKIAAIILAFPLAFWKIFKPNFWIHNLTELFIYAGLAVIFVPVFNLRSIIILLILIAVYDAYAVWKSKHMITLAKSQAEAKIFAGFFIPYIAKSKKSKVEIGKSKQTLSSLVSVKKVPRGAELRTAILGGGDIGFPLLFAGVVFKELGMWPSLIIPFFAAAGLAMLLWKGNEKKFYPAMPFIGAGCLLGLLVVWLLGF